MSTEQTSHAPAASAPSAEYLRYKRGLKIRRAWIIACRFAFLAVILVAWEVLARTHVVNPFLTSYPSAIWPTFLDLLSNHHLPYHTWVTLRATLIGSVISMVLGVGIAAGLWFSDFAHKVFDPFLAIGNAMPKIALVPIFYIWLGSEYSVYGIAVAVALFVTIIVMYGAFRGVDPNRVKLARIFGASRLQVLRMVVLPGSVPVLFSTMKLNIGLSLIGVIVGEFQSANAGLGYLIINGSQVFKLNIVMTAIVVLALLSGVLYLIVARLEARASRRYQ